MASPQDREAALFALALEKPKACRAAFLEAVSGDNPVLRARLDALLAAHEESEASLSTESAPTVRSDESHESPIPQPGLEGLGHPEGKPSPKLDFTDASRDEAVGQVIGRYKLLEKVGEGGCGVVYVAEQTEPVRRRVALKVIKLGMDTKVVVARFEAERQALALMDHPNIAKVLDGGTTEQGRPFFVMELVRGIRITDYCDQNNLTTKERIDLFIKVCQAIQHAHQKGIIHRDIKPSNILVTLHDGVPVPKVIDFGIAKATEGRLTDATVYTQLHQFIGTPAYMSPEQAEMSGLDIDTRSDIYSLGVMLYELLAGSTPFDPKELMACGMDAMRKTIREKEPPRPSTRFATLKGDELTTTAKRRSADTSKLLHQLKGDLDWIVMKCLEKDRTRRYETANGLAFDLKRHLNHEPVLARPPSAAYRFQKLVRRNKLAFAAGGAVAAALLLGIIASTWQSVRATHAKYEALAAQAQEAVQRQKAEANEKKAVESQANEARIREQAQIQELAARRRAYAADLLLCQQALAANSPRGARLLLERQRPAVGAQDLRGWEWRYMWQRCQGDALFKLDIGGRHTLNAIFTKDDNSVVTFAGKGRVSLWDLGTRQEEVVLQDEATNGTFIANSGQLSVSADAEWIAAVGWSSAGESVIRIWDATRRSMISDLTFGTKRINAMTFSRDKHWLAVYHKNEQGDQVSVWNVRTKQSQFQFPIPGKGPLFSPCGAIAFSPDGAVLAIGSHDAQVRLVDVQHQIEKTVLPGRFASSWGVSTLQYSPDGRFLAAGSAFQDPRILVWDIGTNKKIATLEGHRGFITHLTFSPDGKFLASASGDQTIMLWNTDTWKEEDTLLGHNDEVWSVAFSSNGKQLVSSSKDGSVRVWPASGKRQDRESLVLPNGIQSLDVSPDGKSVVGTSEEGTVRLLVAATLREKSVPQELGSNNVAAFWVSPKEILFGSQRPLQLKTWNLSNNVITTYQPDTAEVQDSRFRYLPDPHLLVVTTVSPAARTTTLSTWDVLSHEQISSHLFYEIFRDVALSKDGAWVAFCDNNSLSVRNLRTGQKTPIFQAQINSTQGLALFSQRPWVVAASTDAPIVNVWDIVTGKRLISLAGHNLVLARILVSPDERRLVTSCLGQEPIRFWDPESWNEVLHLQGRSGCFLADPRFLSDGNTFSAVEVDLESRVENYRLWRAPSWEDISAAEAKEKGESKRP